MLQWKFCSVGLLFFTVLPPSTVNAQSKFSAETVLRQADELFASFEPDEQTVDRFLDLVRLYRKTKQPELGESYLATARSKTFNDKTRTGVSHNSLIHFYLSQGDVKNAYEIVHDSPRLNRGFLAQKMMLAELHRGDWNKAARYLGYRYQTEYDNLIPTFVSFAVSSYGLGMLDNALDLIDAQFEDADEVASVKSQVWEQLAWKAWNSKDKQAAFEWLGKALKIIRTEGSLRKSPRYYSLLIKRAYWADRLDQKKIEHIFEEAEQNNIDMYQVKQQVAGHLVADANRLDLLQAVVDGLKTGSQRQFANMKYSLASGYLNAQQAKEAIDVLYSIAIEDDELKSWYFASFAKQCFKKGEYRLAIKVVDLSKDFLEQTPGRPETHRSRERLLADTNRTKYLSQSLDQRKILIPESVIDSERFELLVELVEILVDASE